MLDGARFLGAGHLAEFSQGDARLALLDRVAAHPSPLVRIAAPGGRTVVVNSPEAMAQVYVEHAKDFEKAFLTRHSLAPLAGNGLFTAEGALWRSQRKLMAPMFQPSLIATYAADMICCTDHAVNTWVDGEELSMSEQTTHITMSIAGKTLFDADTFSEADEIGHALTIALDWVSDNFVSPPSFVAALSNGILRRLSLKFKSPLSDQLRARADALIYPSYLSRNASDAVMLEAIAKLDDYVAVMVQERRANPDAKRDLLSHLLAAHDDETQTRMSDKQLRDEVLTLFVAGHETTATSLAWALYYLSRDPMLYAQARTEVDALEGKTPTREDLPRLGFLLRVFKESLRIMPPVYISSRQAWTHTEIAGFEIPMATATIISPYALHHREDIWPDSKRFDPDRFLPEAEAKRHKFAWIPFAAGPRVCIGNHFALMEGQLVLARILQRVDLARAEDDEPAPQATLRPKHGIRVRVSRRSNGMATA